MGILSLIRKRIIDALTSQEIPESEYTNVQVATGSSTSLSGANQTLASVTVPPGAECVITRLYLYAGAATSFSLTYSQTVNGVPNTQTINYSLVSAGDEEHIADMKMPLLAMVNGTTSNVTITLTISSATSGTLYQGNIWYVIR